MKRIIRTTITVRTTEIVRTRTQLRRASEINKFITAQPSVGFNNLLPMENRLLLCGENIEIKGETK